ncbi:uncharacterized protein N0V89_006898 [Didymosphaeria variabile]|uniref:Uncharacterized protein n=1 Tax=Didymosphaeria variabile TaxID=1932322 RepID=A0A9W8XHX0_9PLEO|nr:uncharacterized protein N0V89_006898 [Didymosphaeria variabile]KAJ4351555.1 hypothetical protein N0V89_006898 [Didymosphaeria variabile]
MAHNEQDNEESLLGPMEAHLHAHAVSDDTATEEIQNKIYSAMESFMADATETSDANASHELKAVLRVLYRKVPMTLELARVIQRLADDLSVALGNDFNYLEAVMERHEPEIRRRWIAKTRNERRALLLKVSPHMPEGHRPDLDIIYLERFANQEETSSLSDVLLWPYINLEDLCKTQPLLVFLNARAYNLPWTFALSESLFNPFGKAPGCPGRDKEQISMHFRFTKDPSPGVYGHVRIILEGDVEITSNLSEESIEYCQRQGLHLLYVQQHIMAFLVACVKEILHDKSGEALMNVPILTKDALSDRVNKTTEHTIFADTILLAPYRARSTVDFHRLRAYLAGLFNNAKDHIWALREDPSYMADTIRDEWSHRTEMIMDMTSRAKCIVTQVVREAYLNLAYFKTLYETADRLCQLFEDGVVNDLHTNFHAVQVIDLFARHMKDTLTKSIRYDTWGSPGMRHLYTREQGLRELCFKIRNNATGDQLEAELMHVFNFFDASGKGRVSDGVFFHKLDQLDSILRKNSGAQTMISPRVSQKLGSLSIMVECLRQLSLWRLSPEVQLFLEDHGHCEEKLSNKEGLQHFLKWFNALDKYKPLVTAVDIPQGCLNYPIHHFPNRQNVEQMRAAEKNLDSFWTHLDMFLAESTGQAQHELIQPCLAEHMRRTPAWIDEKTSMSEHVYVPLSRVLHDVSKQITGVFDRCAGVSNAKPKTHGMPNPTRTFPATSLDMSVTDEKSTALKHVKVDKRTFKTIKSIFGMHAQAGDVPKVVKWDEFKRTMIRTGFSAEKLQGSAWQFTPQGNTNVERGIQFHEPHPDSDIPYAMARRFGRRLERVYGWTRETFKLA